MVEKVSEFILNDLGTIRLRNELSWNSIFQLHAFDALAAFNRLIVDRNGSAYAWALATANIDRSQGVSVSPVLAYF